MFIQFHYTIILINFIAEWEMKNNNKINYHT